MLIKIASGNVSVNKRSAYGKWLLGWIDGGGWTGVFELGKAWNYALDCGKPDGCSWYAYGLLMAREQQHGKDELAYDEYWYN